jgi:hypothetical protein
MAYRAPTGPATRYSVYRLIPAFSRFRESNNPTPCSARNCTHPFTARRSPGRRVRRAARAVAAMSLTLGLANISEPAHAADPVLDRYGQKTSVDWPGKVTSDAQLRDDVAADQAYYGSLQPPSRDLYGGDEETQHTMKLSKTGYFHVETVDGRSVLVDPLGNQFFSLGVNSFGSVGDTYTQVTGREQEFAWLPSNDDNGPFADGWRTSDHADYSFYLSNLVRKYGQRFDEQAWYAQQVSRVTKWGFNTAGGFSNLVSGGPKIPYVAHLDDSPGYRIGNSNIPDIYHEGYASELDAKMAAAVERYRDDPYLIGYMFFNEINWAALRLQVTASDGTQDATKQVLISQLQDKYGTIGAFDQAWDLNATSFDELVTMSFSPTTDAAVSDLDSFTVKFLDDFYRLYATTIRTHDDQHMIIGDRWLANVINDDKLRGQLATAAGKYLDALTYNYYSWDLNLDRVKDIYTKSGHKPVIITEFHYGEPTHGLTFAVRMAKDATDKGKLYRNYVEKAAASGMVIGTHWFEYLDQAGTGRWFQGTHGEAGAIGLLDVTDRPYKDMLTSAMQANYSVYNLMDGTRPPYEYPFTPGQADRQSNKTTEIPHATTAPTIDGELDAGWPSGPTLTLGESDLVLGTSEEGVDASMRLAWDSDNLYVYAHMHDPTPMRNPFHGVDIWNGDAIEMFVGPNNVDQGGAIQLKDSQIIISGQPQDAAGTAESHWYNNKPDQPPIPAVVKAAEGGYAIEAAIPLSGLNISSVSVPQRLRFDIGFDDGNGEERQRQYLWNGVDGNAFNRDKWGQATLVEQASDGGGGEQLPTAAQILTTSTVVDGQVIVTGTGKPGEKYDVWLDGGHLGAMTVYPDGKVRYPFDLPTGVRPGEHVVTVTYDHRVLDSSPLSLRPAPKY